MTNNSGSKSSTPSGNGPGDANPTIPSELNTFDADLRSVSESRPPASASRVTTITKHALKYAAQHAKIVAWLIAQFIRCCSPEHKLSGLYFVDSICRGSLTEAKKRGRDYTPDGRDPYVPRFEMLLPSLTSEIQKCSDRDRERIQRLLSVWKHGNVFRPDFLEKAEARWVKMPKPSGSAPPTPHANAESTAQPVSNPPGSLKIPLPVSISLPTSNPPMSGAAPVNTASIIASLSSLANAALPASTGGSAFVPGAAPIQAPAVSNVLADLGSIIAGGMNVMPPNVAMPATSTNPLLANLRFALPGLAPPMSTGVVPPASVPFQIDPAFPTMSGNQRGRFQKMFESEDDFAHIDWANTPVCRPERGPWVQVDGGCAPNQLKVLSRTLYVGGVTKDVTRAFLASMFTKYGTVDSILINYAKFNCFLKMRYRCEANEARANLNEIVIEEYQTTIRVKWGCGFGPKPLFDYETGVSVIDYMNDLAPMDRKWLMTCECGGIREGGLRGGITIEEPDINPAELKRVKYVGAPSGSEASHYAQYKQNRVGSNRTNGNSDEPNRNGRDYPVTNERLNGSAPPWSKSSNEYDGMHSDVSNTPTVVDPRMR